MRNLSAVALAALIPACYVPPQYCEGDPIPEIASPPTSEARVVAQVLPRDSSAVDILFVIDDSRSMKDEQEQLGIWSSELFDVLSTAGGLPDLHIGVTSSSLPITGHAGCTTNGGLRFISDVAGPDGSRVRDYTGTLTEAFAKLARVGDSGCGFEQPFKAAQNALSGTQKFLREDALLLVVFVTDEDDCSAIDPGLFGEQYANGCSNLGMLTSYRCFEHGVTCYDGKGMRAFGERRNCKPNESSPYMQSVKGFADYLKRLKTDPAQVIVAGIYGKPNGINAIVHEKYPDSTTPRLADVCGGGGKEGTGATPAVRMNALMAEFGGRASQSSICDSELAWAMRDVGLITRGAATRSRCLRGALVDTDAAPGVQPRCRVLAGNKEVPFTVGFDAECAETETQLAVQINDASETVTVTCDVGNEELLPSSGESI